MPNVFGLEHSKSNMNTKEMNLKNNSSTIKLFNAKMLTRNQLERRSISLLKKMVNLSDSLMDVLLQLLNSLKRKILVPMDTKSDKLFLKPLPTLLLLF